MFIFCYIINTYIYQIETNSYFWGFFTTPLLRASIYKIIKVHRMFVNCLFFWNCLIWIVDQTTKTILVAHSLKKTKAKLNLYKNSKKWRNIGSTSKKAYFLMKKWHNKFFWASILIEQRIGPPGNFIEFCTRDIHLDSRVLQTIQMKLILLCVWAEWAILGSAKTALKFKHEIQIC